MLVEAEPTLEHGLVGGAGQGHASGSRWNFSKKAARKASMMLVRQRSMRR